MGEDKRQLKVECKQEFIIHLYETVQSFFFFFKSKYCGEHL